MPNVGATPWIFGTAVFASLAGVVWQAREAPKLSPLEHSHGTHDFRLVLLVVIFLFDGLFLLAHAKAAIELPDIAASPEGAFGRARIEWLVALASVIGIAGTIWAVLAKRDAERAFLEAQKTRQAIFQVVPFDEIPSIVEQMILSAREDLVAVLGVPAVGFFLEETREQAVRCCDCLAARISSDLGKLSSTSLAEITLLYLDDTLLGKLVTRARGKGLSQADETRFNDIRNNLRARIEGAQKNTFKFGWLKEDPGLRFVIRKDLSNPEREKALFWLVSDFDEENPTGFGAVGFMSQDLEFLKVLKALAKEKYRKTDEKYPKIPAQQGVQSGTAS